MAIAAVLPRNEHSERNLLFTVLSVTVLSTLAMIAYPILSAALEFDDMAAGIFIGGTIHDVAQVVGAGFSVSNEAGETATLVKLIRVSMLAPVVLVFAIIMRSRSDASEVSGKRPPLVPTFVIGFMVLATLNSLHLIPVVVADFFSELSRWALLIAIAAVGMKTSLSTISTVGGQAIVLIVSETLFIAGFIVIGIHYLR